MAVARKVRVTGTVQGVFFRAWTQEQARLLGLNGWVRNCRDGSVEAHIQGDEGAVHRLIECMRRGPSGARVECLNVGDAEVEGLVGFEVRR